MIPMFVENYCGLDGSFVFAIIRRNTNYMTACEIISNLYSNYCLQIINTKREDDYDDDDEEEEQNGYDLSENEKKSNLEFIVTSNN